MRKQWITARIKELQSEHDKLVTWKEILQCKKLLSCFEVWSSDNEAYLNDLWKMKIKLEKPALCSKVVVEK